MVNAMEDVQKMTKENMDRAMTSFGAFSKGFQALAVESADFSKKSFEEGSAAMEKLLGAKSLDKAVEIQNDYVKSSYESAVGQFTKVGEMVADMAKEGYAPYEAFLGKAGK